MAEEEKVPQGDSSSEETQKNKKKVIIGVCVVVALIVIFIIVLLLLLGSCTHRHTMIYHPAVEPTCDTPGSVQYWHCDECGNDYLDEKGHERIDDVTIDILPHVPVTDLGVAPGCESEGLTEGSHCATCGEVIVAQEVIPALGHETKTFTRVSNPTCTQTGLETSVCSRCWASRPRPRDLHRDGPFRRRPLFGVRRCPRRTGGDPRQGAYLWGDRRH